MAKQIDTQAATFVVVYDMNDANDFVVAFESAEEAGYFVDLNRASCKNTHYEDCADMIARVLEDEEREWFAANYKIDYMVSEEISDIVTEDKMLVEKLLDWSDEQREAGTLLDVECYDEQREEALEG